VKKYFTVLLLVSLLPLIGCSYLDRRTAGAALAGEAQALEGAAGQNCPIIVAPEVAFVPPAPWPDMPPDADRFWFGEAGLWTALPVSGKWPQLASGEKFLLWSEEFDVTKDETPDITLTARRLDGKAPLYQTTHATNLYHESVHWAMLVGVHLPSPGCWQFDIAYKDHHLDLVLWAPDHSSQSLTAGSP
jgi:hypothetical protein